MTTFREGDLVEAGGDRWTVTGYRPPTPYLAGAVTVGRTTAGDASVQSVVRDFPESDVKLITPFAERSVIIENVRGLMIVRAKDGEVLATYLEGPGMSPETWPPAAFTDEQLDILERLYTPASRQKCIVCGDPLTFASSGAGGSDYTCSSDAASVVKNDFRGPDWEKALEHYRASRWRDHSGTDIAVVALIHQLRAARMALAQKEES